ncbi:MAG TPA: hemin uptake protein HemP [Gammaproteobacteria bacterium]|nr:hemin uptake protein HemP [Gammaproteobacteria bacterium]
MRNTPPGNLIPNRLDPPPSETERTGEKRIRDILSEELFNGDDELNINHGKSVYRLRKTSNGKLILTK